MIYESNGDFMNNQEKIIKFMQQNNGYIATKDFLSLGITKNKITEYIKKGIIKKVSHGLYLDCNLLEDEYYIIQRRYSNVVFSYNTAFHILNLTNRTPIEIDITTIRSNNIKGHYNVHYVTEDKFDIGKIEVISPFGNKIYVYNAERSICDMLKSNDFELELQNRILNEYFHSENKNLDQLIEYSKVFNIYDKVNTILEVMMKW